MKRSCSAVPNSPPSSDAIFPVGIVHCEDQKESQFSAIGVLQTKLPSSLKDSEDICIFSQERLCDCEQLGIIVFSKTLNGSLQWHPLCNHKAPLDHPDLP